MKDLTTEKDEQLLSKSIDFMRFPMIVGVVFIHALGVSAIVGGKTYGFFGAVPIYSFCSNLFSNILGRVCLIIFWFTSGYLFFYKTDFSFDVYKKKIKKRVHTLLIPFLFWNAFSLIIYYIFMHIPQMNTWFSYKEYSLNYIATNMWGKFTKHGLNFPFAYQFWFIRDLFVISLLTPIIYLIIAKTKKFCILLLIFFGLYSFYIPYICSAGLNSSGLYFFSLGAFFSINKINMVTFSRKYKYIFLLYPIIVFIILYNNMIYNKYMSLLNLILGIGFFFYITAWLLENNKISVNNFLLKSSFFIFAIHEPWLLKQSRKIFFSIINPDSDLKITLLYFTVVIITIVVSLLIYNILSKFLPKFTAIITGGH